MPWFRRKQQTGGTGAPIVVSVRDPADAAAVPLPKDGLLIGDVRLPSIDVASETDALTASMRRNMPDHSGPAMGVLMHHNLHHDQLDTPQYVGAGNRAAIVLRVAKATMPDLTPVGMALREGDPWLYLQVHRSGDHAVLRAALIIGKWIWETPLDLAAGDTQEFLAAAHAQQAIEIHVGHQKKDQLLARAYRAENVRTVLDPALPTLADLPPAPKTEADRTALLRASYPQLVDGLTDDNRVFLTADGDAGLSVGVPLTL
jgi:hypothetical protein